MESETPFTIEEVSVEDVISKGIREFKRISAEDDYDILFDEDSDILKAVRKQAENDAQLNRKLAPLVAKEASSAELEAAMSTVLSAEEIQLIKDTFLIDTYQVEVYTCSKPGPKSFVKFLREGEEIFPDITLDSSSKILEAKMFQWASIVVEVFMLALSAIGIKVALKQREMAKVCKKTAKILKTSAFRGAMNAFKNAWAKGSKAGRAKAIFIFLKDSMTAGIFWKVMKSIVAEMFWWSRAKSMAMIATMIVAVFATGGWALIAKIILAALDSAYTLIVKMKNLEALEKIEQEQNEMVMNNLIS